jgi:hypothetical protein
MRFLAILLIAFLSASATLAAVTFQVSGSHDPDSAEMRLVLDVAALRLQKLIEAEFPDTVSVIIVKTKSEFDSVARGILPEWGAAAAIPSRDLIIIREPHMDRYPGNTANLLQHELAHIALHRRVRGQRIPRFLDEGFASWFAGEWRFANVTAIAGAQLTGSLLPLADIDQVSAFHHGKANLAYSQSYLVVQLLLDRFGEVGWLELLDSLAAGRNLRSSFRDVYGVSFWQFESEYRQFIQDNYSVMSILSGSMGLWVILALLVIAGFIVVRQRRKEAIDRWKEEEKLESTDFDWDGSDSPWD